MSLAVRARLLACLLVAVCTTLALAQPPAGYYATVDTATSDTLRPTLHAVISAGTINIPFANSSASFQALGRIDADHAVRDHVRLIYSDDRRPYNSPTTTDGNPATGGWNREHIFPQSYMPLDGPEAAEPTRGDLHALYPADADINGQRSNKPYDAVASPTYTDVFGNRSDSNWFEPLDAHKGEVARSLFYMDVRYEGTGGEPEIKLAENDAGSQGETMARLSTLLAWHEQFPVSAFEMERNNRAFAVQGNRNPFVDNPQWVTILYGSTPASVSDGDTVTVAGGLNLAPPSVEAHAFRVPYLAFTLEANTNEFHVDSFTFSTLGDLPYTEIAELVVFHDADADAALSLGDVIVARGPFTSTTTTFAAQTPFVLEAGDTQHFLVTLTIDRRATIESTVAMQLDANGIAHSPTGGNDVDPTFSAIFSDTSQIYSGGVNIVSVSTRGGGAGAAAQEYIVLANHSNDPVDITGWELQSRAGTGTGLSRLEITAGIIPAGAHFIIADDDYTDINDVEGVVAQLLVPNILGGMGDSTARSIALFDGTDLNARKIDGFSWANGPTSDPFPFATGTPFSGVLSTATQARRANYARLRPGGTSGPYQDTLDNETDLEIFVYDTVDTPKPPPSDSDAATPPIIPGSVDDWWMLE